MPTVDSLLRRAARAHPDTPFWVLEKDYALSYRVKPDDNVTER